MLNRKVFSYSSVLEIVRSTQYLKMEKTAILEFLPPHRHLQIFWGKSGDFWQTLWDKFIDFAGKLIVKLVKLEILQMFTYFR